MQVVFVTTSNMDEAKKIAKTLVGERRAACVNIVPNIISIYEWKDDIHEDNELLLIIKTSSIHLVEQRIKELHSYEVPEIIAFDIDEGSEEYLGWMRSILVQ